MIAKSGASLVFYAFYTDSGAGKTGLADVTVDVWEVARDGTAAEVATAQAATEVGDGLYRYILAAGTVDAAAEYIAVFKTAGTVDQAHLPALWTVDRQVPEHATGDAFARIGAAGAGLTDVPWNASWDAEVQSECADAITAAGISASGVADAVLDEALSGHTTAGTAGAALGRVGSGQVTTVSTVAQSGDMTEIIAGADYLTADGYQFDWTDASAAWPTLTAATIEWEASGGGQTYTAAGSVVTPTGASKKVRLELTAAQSAAIAALHTGAWEFVVWATLSSGSIIPLVQGSVPVKDTPGP